VEICGFAALVAGGVALIAVPTAYAQKPVRMVISPFLTAAFTGLRRGDVLFDQEFIRVRASYSYGVLTAPKSGRPRAVPLVRAVAERLAPLPDRNSLMSRQAGVTGSSRVPPIS
jgi:hypothetical protein